MRKFLMAVLATVSISACAFALSACNTAPDNIKVVDGVSYELQEEGYWKCVQLQSIHKKSVEIESEIDGKPVTQIDGFGFKGSKITSVEIPDSVTYIGGGIFSGCLYLENVIIPDGIAYINSSAFENCPSLEYSEYGNSLYLGNENNPYVALIKAKDAGVKSCNVHDKAHIIIESAFKGSALEEVDFGSGLQIISENAFRESSSLKKVTFGNGLQSIGDSAFAYCSALDGVKITDSVKTVGISAFSHCTSLKSIDLGSGVTVIDKNAFDSCSLLKEIILPESLTTIGGSAFYGCTSFTDMTVPAGVTRIENSAFADCFALTIYCKSQSKGENWEESWNSGKCPVVWNCDSNKKDEDGYEYSVIDGIKYALKGNNATVAVQPKTVESLVVPETVTYDGASYNLTSVGKNAFMSCNLLTSVTLPAGVTEVGKSAFANCYALTLYCKGNENTGGWDAMWNCDDTDYSKDPVYCEVPIVWNCESNKVANDGKIYSIIGGIRYALEDGVALVVGQPVNIKEANVPKTVNYVGADYTVLKIGKEAFKNCNSLGSVTLPDGLTEIGNEAFYWCVSLKSINLPLSVTKIGNAAFRNCETLEEFTIPAGVTKIGTNTFRYCKMLKNVVIPNSVTEIGNGAFYNCESLEELTIPKSVTSFGNNSLASCRELKSINYNGTSAQWEAITKGAGWSTGLSAVTVYCTDADIVLTSTPTQDEKE